MATITNTLIELDRAADTLVPLKFRDKSTGLPIDISTADLAFVVKGNFTLVPALNPSNAQGRILHFTEDHARQLGSKTRPFMLTRKLNGLDQVLWRGDIVATGFAR